jgi:hypothetical protein
MLAVVGAMAALSIDLVTIYAARSEAQLAADAAALAGARVLANSGVTSNPSPAMITAAWNLASAVATQVAQQNEVGGGSLTSITIPGAAGGPNSNPTITVTVQKDDLPSFFARIWGRTAFTVKATATAEAYNPSAAPSALTNTNPPVAPICVKPWLLPNIDPTQSLTTGPLIFNAATGAIMNPGLVGQEWPNTSPTATNPNLNGLYVMCGDCSPGAGGITGPAPGQYYPGAAADFPAPASAQAPSVCSAGFNAYQLSVAGCVQQPISCGAAPTIDIDTNPYVNVNGSRDADTVAAAGCLIHYNVPGGAAGDSDSIDNTVLPTPPFEFLAGNQNPVALARGKDVLVSDSLVTLPVISGPPSATGNTVIGFLQVFLNPSATAPFPYTNTVPPTPVPNEIPATIINLVGCGTSATGTPILGNGASPVAVRLISPQ